MLGVRRRGFVGTTAPLVGAIRMSAIQPVVVQDDDTSSWQLAAGHYQSSVFAAPDIWLPRADAFTDASDYHRKIPTGMDRWIPICPVGMAPPWWGTINQGPPGAVFDSDPTSPMYMTVYIPAQSATSGTLSVSVFGQDSTAITRSWSYQIIDRDNTDHFVHLVEGSGGTLAGTSSNPKRLIGQIVGPDEDDDTWVGRQVIVTGTHTLVGQAAEYDGGGIALVMNDNKPQVWVASSIGGATIQGSTDNLAGAWFDWESGRGQCYVGFNFRNPHINGSGLIRNCFIHTGAGGMQDGGIFFNDFDMDSTANQNDSNSSCLMLAAGSIAGNFAVFGNTFHDGNQVDFGFIKLYDGQNVWVGRNTITNCVSPEGFHLKGGDIIDGVAFYFNTGTGNACALAKVESIDLTTAPFRRRNIEFMHNRFASTYKGIWVQASPDVEFGIYSKRNNWVVPYHDMNGSHVITGSLYFDHDIIEHNGTFSEGVRDTGTTAGVVITRGDNLETGLNDTTAAQTTPNGTHGAEVL